MSMSVLKLPFTWRYICVTIAVIGTVAFGLLSFVYPPLLIGFAIFLAIAALGFYDVLQTRHSILRSYPLSARLRFLLERVRPEIRQYFLESDTDGTPFNRAKRSIVYQRAKGQLDKRPLGTQLDVYAVGFEWLNHSTSPRDPNPEQFRIAVGGPDCAQPYSASVSGNW